MLENKQIFDTDVSIILGTSKIFFRSLSNALLKVFLTGKLKLLGERIDESSEEKSGIWK